MVWIIISIVLGSIILLIEGSFIQNSSYVFYLIIVILLITVLFMPAVKGAKSWFQFGGFSIQPSEFAKLGCSLAFARYLSLINTRTQNLKNRLTAGAIVMVPALLIMIQPDPGTMLVFIGFVIVNSDLQRKLKGSKPFQDEKERMIIVNSIKGVDKAILSIDKDRTVCETIKKIAIEYGKEYSLAFANGGDQNNDTIPEKPVCEQLGVELLDGLGDKIQSSSWLLNK